jgi:hypothetical protein
MRLVKDLMFSIETLIEMSVSLKIYYYYYHSKSL